ncbi:hypothetical protein FHG64_06470 [Antarcticibacterium flavum]|uniref:Uncharacterized protein n=1 Tax=Antarcticibacterium flavum TaxID=2058175 RepID=A0A5B7X186_9FLAO|nr:MULTISPECIES: hypothetical protein [Antarcticibacterium]MCM4161294.1 hypothetical protein [Antarcticibacterium sp. W02-3]QCY69079.1 hypothetical protein FHG64_06470 [Antarcticibacterium flavum]
MTLTVITSIASLLIGFFASRFFYLYKNYQNGKVDGAFEKEKELFYNYNKESIKSKLENRELELQFLKGKEEGQKEERKKIEIQIIPRIYVEDGIFSKTLFTGYDIQVKYDTLPIGGTQYYPENTIEKFKDENFKYVADLLQKTVIDVAEKFINKGFSVDALKAPKVATA